jgi:hypothetical protein
MSLDIKLDEAEKIVIRNKSPEGIPLEAVFLPQKGMNMISYKKGDIEVIDQSTLPLFEERFAGLGALIGPHFHHRNPAIIPPIKDESLFPHIARVKANGVKEPFSHGIARYAPWKAQATETRVQATITGKDEWNGVPLSALEGQNFTMKFDAELLPDGLHLHLSVVSDTDSVVGIHYYYNLPKSLGILLSQVQSNYIENGELKPIPSDWDMDDQQWLTFDLMNPADYTFYPFPNPLEAEITLDVEEYRIITRYKCNSQENSWQLYHPLGASFVCIEPLSAQDPRHPNLTASSIDIVISVE